MILVAERMFAERGIYAVSLRQINIEADQRNGSALHYHFGSREGLISSIFEYRMEPINQLRMEMLEEIKDKATPDLPDIHSLIKALLVPAIAHLKIPGETTHFSRFLSQTACTYTTQPQRLLDNKHNSGRREIRRLIYSVLRDTPEPIINQRIAIMERTFFQSTADFEAQKEELGDAIEPYALDLLANNMVDCIYSILTAPISESTNSALQNYAAKAAE